MFGKKKNEAAAPVATPSVDLSKAAPEHKPDDLGRFPGEVDINPSRTRSQERALRAVSLVAIVSAMMNIAMIMLMITLFPLQKVYPFLVTFKSQDNQVVSIEPMAMNAPGILYATEDSVRDYVVQRHSFVPIVATMNERWGPNSRLAARSSKELFAKFSEASKTELTQMMSAGYDRRIDINSVQRIGEDTWQVNFTTHDVLPGNAGTLTGNTAFGSQPSTSGIGTPGAPTVPVVSQQNDQNWVATMRVTYAPQNVTYDKRLLNPLGFTVTDYSVSRNAARN